MARLYVIAITLCGGAAVAASTLDLLRQGVPSGWFLLAALTLVSGSITVKVPSVPATISVSETFVFTAVLLFGPAAGTIIVALDCLVISLWLHKKLRRAYQAAFNVAAPALSIYLSAKLFFLFSGIRPLNLAPDTAVPSLLIPLGAFTALYFVLNSSLIALAIGFERKVSALTFWRENFLWLSLNYFGGASVAALLVAYSKRVDWASVGVIVPLLVISYLTSKTAMGRLEDTANHLSQLNLLYLSTIETLARAIDARDQVTHGHIRRVQVYAVDLARTIGVSDSTLLKAIEAAALLHDLGKLRVPEHILNKPGRLTPSEFERIKSHSQVGAEILSSIEFPYPVVPIVKHHHENWDGSGYPDHLSGTDIPIGARVLAVVDCFDALTSDRPYRGALSESAAIRILLERRGSMYDPVVVDAFIAIHCEAAGADGGSSGHSSTPESHRVATSGRRAPRVPEAQGSSTSESQEEPRARVTTAGGFEALEAPLCRLGAIRGLRAAVVYVPSDASGGLVMAAEVAVAESGSAPKPINFGGAVSRWVATNRNPVETAFPELELGTSDATGDLLVDSCASVPVLAEGRLLGVVTAFGVDSDAMGIVARQIGDRVSDCLAGLPRTLMVDGDPEASEAQVQLSSRTPIGASAHPRRPRPGTGVVVLRVSAPTQVALDSVDVDVIVAGVTAIVRPNDLVLPLADAGLVVLLPGADGETLDRVADRARTAAGVAARLVAPSRLLRIDVGVARVSTDGGSIEAAIAKAKSDANLSAIQHRSGESSIH